MRNVSDKSCIEYENTFYIQQPLPPLSEKGAICEICVEKFGRSRQTADGNTVQRMRFSCWKSEGYRHTKIIFNTYCFATTTVVKRTRLKITLPLLFTYLFESFKMKI